MSSINAWVSRKMDAKYTSFSIYVADGKLSVINLGIEVF